MMPSLFLKEIATKAELADFAVKTRSSRSSSKDSCLNVTAPVNISNGKNAATKAQIQNLAENQRFRQLVHKMYKQF